VAFYSLVKVKKKIMIITGAALLVFGFIVQLLPYPDIMVGDFPLGAYLVGSISGIGLCLIGFAIVYDFMARHL